MRLPEIITSLMARLYPPPPAPDRPMSTPDDVRWQRRQIEALKREADMLGVDVSLDQANRQ